MNKKLMPVIIVLAVAALGLGAVVMSKKAAPQTQAPEITGQDQGVAETVEGSIKSLVAAGKSMKCTFTNAEKDMSVEGTVYAAGGKVRQDYKSTSAQVSTSGHMIIDATNSYMWMDGSNQGYKFAVTEQAANSPTTDNQTADINQTMKFNCGPWMVDNSMFETPGNVNFQTLAIPGASMVPAAPGQAETGVMSQCAACDSVPAGAARDACKTQLKCK